MHFRNDAEEEDYHQNIGSMTLMDYARRLGLAIKRDKGKLIHHLKQFIIKLHKSINPSTTC